MKHLRILRVLLLIVILLGSVQLVSRAASAHSSITSSGSLGAQITLTPTAVPEVTREPVEESLPSESSPGFLPDILDRPVLPENPTQADQGSMQYYLVCMACHGDHGQGLTDDFRALAFGEDMNCWVSKCHALNHPPQGFDFPRFVPALIGDGTLSRFVTAAELFDYLKATMPWWSMGSLSDEDAWNLTAFLLRENKVLAEDIILEARTARLVPVHLPAPSYRNDRISLSVFLGIFAVAILATLAVFYRSARRTLVAAAPQRPNFYQHLHPALIPARQSSWRHTLGVGGLSVFLSLVVGATGILEMFFYNATPDLAAISVQVITFQVPFGSLVRGVHYWSAQALVVTAALHLLRILLTGAYNRPRRFNYLIGLGLFVVVLLFDFTGYVLRWDEGIRWALLVGTNLIKTIPWAGDALYAWVVGGSEPGPATLTRFYAWHIFGLTLLMGILLVWHLFRIRRDGGISAPPVAQRTDVRTISRFDLAAREGRTALIAGLLLLLLASLLPAPLAAPIQQNQLGSLGEARAPWFFLWVQQLLRYGNAFWLGIALPLILLILLAVLPFITSRLPPGQQGRWFPSAGRIVQVVALLLALGWVILTILELTYG